MAVAMEVVVPTDTGGDIGVLVECFCLLTVSFLIPRLGPGMRPGLRSGVTCI